MWNSTQVKMNQESAACLMQVLCSFLFLSKGTSATSWRCISHLPSPITLCNSNTVYEFHGNVIVLHYTSLCHSTAAQLGARTMEPGQIHFYTSSGNAQYSGDTIFPFPFYCSQIFLFLFVCLHLRCLLWKLLNVDYVVVYNKAIHM